MKRLITIMSLILILMTNSAMAHTESGYGGYSTTGGTVNIGQNIDIYSKISGVSNIGAIQYSIYYDKNIVEPINVVNGKLIPSDSNTMVEYYIDTNAGKINVAIISINGFGGSGKLVKITFKSIKKGQSNIRTEFVDLTDPLNNKLNYPKIRDSIIKVRK